MKPRIDTPRFHGRRIGVECKFAEAPAVARSMHTALGDLRLDHLYVVHPGPHRYPAHPKITAWPLSEAAALAAALLAPKSGPRPQRNA
ncbi:MAG: hypothetical protein FJ291_09815 [Planctomycetes bacterium]|nr:hypothetical protein [Planctomycetota bacterium]